MIDQDLVILLAMMGWTIGAWLWCRRNPSYRQAERDWARFRDLFGINLTLKHPFCRLFIAAPFVLFLIAVGYGYLFKS